MRNTAVQIAIVVVALTTIAGCRNKESTTRTPAAREDQKPTASSPSTTNSPQAVDKGPASSNRPRMSDSDLVQKMK